MTNDRSSLERVLAGSHLPAALRRLVQSQYPIAVPLLLLIVLSAPCITYMLPSRTSQLGEDYQPLDTLRFFHSRGQSLQRYGVFPNFVLAPGYAATLAWWSMNGDLEDVSSDFPYGFRRPLEQLGVLIGQGRLVMLACSIGLLAWFGRSLAHVTQSRLALFVALFTCLGTNHALAFHLANTRPDGLGLSLTAAALGMYLLIVDQGLTVRHAVVWGVLIGCATSCKEIAAFFFVLPFLWVTWSVWRDSDRTSRRGQWRAWWAFVVSAAGTYALINIVYAPTIWWHRIEFWLGNAAGREIYASVSFEAEEHAAWFVRRMFEAILNNLGPGGIVIAGLSLAVIIAGRKGRHVDLRDRGARHNFFVPWSAPLVSVLTLILIPLGFVQDRYYLYVSLACVPLVANAVDMIRLTERPRHLRLAGGVALGVLLSVNLWFSMYAVLRLENLTPFLIEHDVVARADAQTSVYVLQFDLGPRPDGGERLQHLGYHLDARALTEVLESDPADRPTLFYVPTGPREFLEGAVTRPARAEFLRTQYDFDIQLWSRLDSLGYRSVDELQPELPRWFPFGWMPAVRDDQSFHSVTVYRR